MVLDEADEEMLRVGFSEGRGEVLSADPEEKQVALFLRDHVPRPSAGMAGSTCAIRGSRVRPGGRPRATNAHSATCRSWAPHKLDAMTPRARGGRGLRRRHRLRAPRPPPRRSRTSSRPAATPPPRSTATIRGPRAHRGLPARRQDRRPGGHGEVGPRRK
ncbi:hypothetical protein QJS66_19970 [Kocuria rhizophila]|nr:hypothetical protein QJS66_19970 [Kocuria rhizophila]